MYCVYVTIYNGLLLPKRYIGSCKLEKISTGYNGSVVSKKYKDLYKSEQKNNKHLFKTRILSRHNTDKDARLRELQLQIKYDVVKSKLYMNESLAKVDGYFGRDVSGKNNPMFGKSRSGEKHDNGINISNGLKKFFASENGSIEKINRSERFKGEKNPMYGKKHRSSTIEKMKANNNGNGMIIGSIKNKKLYTNGEITIALSHGEDIPVGFIVGRHTSAPNKGMKNTPEQNEIRRLKLKKRNNGLGVPKHKNVYLIDGTIIMDLNKFCEEFGYSFIQFKRNLKKYSFVYGHEVTILKGRRGNTGVFYNELYYQYQNEINLLIDQQSSHI